MKKILFIMLMVCVKQINAQFCFNLEGTTYPANNTPTAIITADFNKDGKADLAVSNEGTDDVSILLGNGFGGFGGANNFSIPANSQPLFLCTADFNEDGNLDIATANANANNVSILLGSGTGSFINAGNYNTPGTPFAVCTADFNADGHMDLAEANGNANNISVLLGTGTGSFGTPFSFPVGTNPYGICTGDFNKDGKIDLAVVNDVTNNVSVLINTITSTTVAPTFTTSATINTIYASPRSIISVDINLDGNLDLAFANEGAGSVCSLSGNGNGTFNAGPASTINPSGTSEPRAITSADFNGDGHPDLATADYGTTPPPFNASVIANVGAPGQNFNLGAAQNPHGICSADFNGDGAPDLAIANASSNDVSILLNGYPTVKISGDSSICKGSTTTLTATGSNVGFYTWSTNAGGASTATVAVTPTATTTYTVTNQNAACSYIATAVITVTVNALPNVSIASTSNTICSGASATLTPGPASTYTWSTNANTGNIVVSPTVTTTYSVSGTSIYGCVNSASYTLDVFASPTVTVNSPAICIGSSATITAGGISNGTYTWSTNATGATITPSPTVNASYTVTGTDGNGCTNMAVSNVMVNSLPNVQINGMNNGISNICAGSSTVLNGGGAVTYTWSTSVVATHITVIPTAGEMFSVTGADLQGCTNSTEITFNVNNLPTVTVNSATVCAGTVVHLQANGAITYTWSNSATTNTISVTAAGNTSYTVTGTDVNTCTNTAVATISAPANPAPSICMVTTDSVSNYDYNIIYWTNTDYPNADSFIVYRNHSGTYLRLGAVAKDSSHFTDIYRNIGGPNGGNPNSTAFKYTMAVKDTCGNVSAQSVYHQTTNVYVNGSNIDWNDYTINGVAAIGYDVYWDSLGVGDFTLLQSGLTSNQVNVPSFGTYSAQNFRVDPILSYTCNTQQRLAGGNNSTFGIRQKSHSNTSRQAGVGVKQIASGNRQISIYPNPTKDNFTIETNVSGKQTIQLFDVNGKLVLSQTINGKTNIDVSNLNDGVYNVNVIGNEGVVNKRLVIVR